MWAKFKLDHLFEPYPTNSLYHLHRMETKCSFHRVTKLLHSTFTKNDHILVTSPRTTIFWGSSLLSKNDHILDTSPSSSTPSSFKICLDPAKDSWWFKVLRLTSKQVGVYLADFTYLPGHFHLSTWPILLIYLAIFRTYLASPSEDTATATQLYST